MSTWTELVSTALVGTERRAFVPSPSPGSSPDSATAAGTDPAQALLREAMLAALPALTGTQPAPYEGPLPQPAPADERPLIPSAARLRLRAVVDVYPKYLGEWLAAVRAAGCRLPSAALPGLLDAGRNSVEIRGELAEVLGERGRWLARQNPEWRYLLREPLGPLRPEDWDGPDPDARLAYANGLYARDPEAARALFAAAWPTLNAAGKMGLLSVVSRHRTKTDLPFLERLAQDSSKQVREEARLIASRLTYNEQNTKELTPEEFAAQIGRLADTEGVGVGLSHFAMQRTHGQWSLDAARTLFAVLIEYSSKGAPDQTGDQSTRGAYSRSHWAAEQLLGVLADRGPLELRPDVERALQAQASDTASGAGHRLDLSELHTLLGFRAEMHAELTASADAATGQE